MVTSDLSAGAATPSLWRRIWDRSLYVLLLQPAELAEFCVGCLALVAGLGYAVLGSGWQDASGDVSDGLALAAFGLPQIVAAVHGSVRWRHVSNGIGCFAALLNAVRSYQLGVHVGTVYFGVLACLCALFLLRTEAEGFIERARTARLES